MFAPTLEKKPVLCNGAINFFLNDVLWDKEKENQNNILGNNLVKYRLSKS